VTIADFRGSRIRAFRQYWDEVALLEQLDLLPDD
jgi:ketosteroid isomerase-like protein